MDAPFIKITPVKRNYQDDKHVASLHKHQVYELYFLIQGRTDYYVEGSFYKLRPGDLLITRPEESHIWINQNGEGTIYEQVVIRFNPEAIAPEHREAVCAVLEARPFGQHNCYPAAIFPERPWFSYLPELLEGNEDIARWQPALTALLQQLCLAYPTLTQKVAQPENLAGRVIAYIHDNLTQPLNMDMLCQKFYISRAHLHRLFRNATGSSVWDYVIEMRLLLAKALLENGEHPTSVWEKSGFNDYSAFYKSYTSRFGVSPQAHKGTGAYTFVDPKSSTP